MRNIHVRRAALAMFIGPLLVIARPMAQEDARRTRSDSSRAQTKPGSLSGSPRLRRTSLRSRLLILERELRLAGPCDPP